MDLKSRLARLDRTTAPAGSGPQGARRSAEPLSGDEPASRAAAPAQGNQDIWTADPWDRELGLIAEPTLAGPVWCRDELRAAGDAPGRLADLRAILRDPDAARHSDELLFLDTETTGLAGGTGSLAFLVGLAWWEREGLRVRQLFLPGPGREAPLLAELERTARRFRALVTFNGTTFDRPLLRTRALLARRADPLGHLAGWDLLTAARRLWGRRLPNLRQVTVEALVCQRRRAPDDIPGALIPQTYFRFLQVGETAGLRRTLRHNARDMEGMARIFNAVVAEASALDPDGPTAWATSPSWQDAWSLGRIAEARRDRARAAAWMARAVADAGLLPATAASAGEALSERFLADAIRILKRVRHWELVRGLVEAGLIRYRERRWLRREAAILYEHRLARPDLALPHAEVLGERRRLRRLRRKLAG